MSSDKLLEVNNLTIAFRDEEKGWRRVVDGVSYQLGRGETLGIVGESGSGKSVSVMGLLGLLPGTARVSGHAWLSDESDGVDRTDLLSLDEEGFREVRGKRISMIFQEPMTSLNPVQRCGEQVMEMMRAHQSTPNNQNNQNSPKDQVIELFREVLLPRPEKIFDSYPHELSGGQKQRVMIAMALINHPDIIIADEPTTALDVTVQKTILELLRVLQKKHGISIIFISHDLGVIAQIADDILVMYQGKVVERGATSDILNSPKHPYTQGLLACRPPLEGRPRRLPTVEDYMSGKLGADDGERRGEDEERKTEDGIGKPLLSVRSLSVEYVLKKSFIGRPLQKLKAVDGISFDVFRGETLGIVGESGCGKTTLGRALLRLLESRSEQIVFEGKRIDQMSQREMREMRTKMQIVFQDPYSSLNPRITLGDAIMEPLLAHGVMRSREEARCKVLDLMEHFGLKKEWFSRYPHEFSGGQRQRICIARALILNPELVVCDESVSALDVSVQAQVLNLLGELKERFGYTYLFISHDLSVVHYVADRIMVMKSGRIVESGDTDEVYRHPKEEYTRCLLEAIPRME